MDTTGLFYEVTYTSKQAFRNFLDYLGNDAELAGRHGRKFLLYEEGSHFCCQAVVDSARAAGIPCRCLPPNEWW